MRPDGLCHFPRSDDAQPAKHQVVQPRSFRLVRRSRVHVAVLFDALDRVPERVGACSNPTFARVITTWSRKDKISPRRLKARGDAARILCRGEMFAWERTHGGRGKERKRCVRDSNERTTDDALLFFCLRVDRRHQAIPSVGVQDPGSPGELHHRGHRSHHGSARYGYLQRRRFGHD
jgi:hypothetical protein